MKYWTDPNREERNIGLIQIEKKEILDWSK